MATEQRSRARADVPSIEAGRDASEGGREAEPRAARGERATQRGAKAEVPRARAAKGAATRSKGTRARAEHAKATSVRVSAPRQRTGSQRTGSQRQGSKPRSSRRPPPPKASEPKDGKPKDGKPKDGKPFEISVRHLHRRDLNRVWEFLKLTFRDVNRKTVEYQRPRSKERFVETYDDEGIEQLVFEVGAEVVGYAECAYNVTGSDNWINPRYFGSRNMRPLFVEELATHPDYQGRGVGSFMLEQLEHLAHMHGCTHLVLEVAENNKDALAFYRRRTFTKLDASIFMAKRLERARPLLPPRKLKPAKPTKG